MQITLNKLKELGSCPPALRKWEELGLKELTLEQTINKCMELKRFDWANRLIIETMTVKQRGQYAVYAAELVAPIYNEKYPYDNRVNKAIEAAKRALENDNTKKNRNAADSAYYAGYSMPLTLFPAARYAAYSASYAAYAAVDAAAYAVAESDGYPAVVFAADSAYYAASAAACSAVRAAHSAGYSVVVFAAAAEKKESEMKLKIVQYGLKIIKEVKYGSERNYRTNWLLFN